MSEMNWPLIILVGLAFLSVTASAVLAMLHHYAGKNGKLNHLNALIDKARHDLAQIEDKREEYERAKKFVDERQGWEAEKNALMEAVVAKEQEVQKLGDQKDQLAVEIEKLGSVVDGMRELEKEAADTRTAVSKLMSEQKTINEQVGQLKKDIDELEQKKVTLLAEQKEVVLDIAVKESKFKSFADEVKKLEDDLKSKREKLDIDVKALTEIERDLVVGRAESAALKKQNAELEDSNKVLSVENKKLQDANQRLSPVVTSLEARKAAAEQWMKDNSSRLADMEDLERKIAQKKEDYEAIGKRIEDAQKTLAETMKAVEKALDRLAKMNVSGIQTLRLSSFDSLKDGEGSFRLPDANGCEPAFGADEEANALRVVSEHFAANGFEVPQRLLYAFHTSLKTSDMSSLTVMAGVSGTGKSAIPKLYSEAMGIFFSPLAVEPRWDSPKDLMGFFNYVTNRYEPTPLARAMFQFQGLWDDDFKPEMALDKYMFMPMLDEMNLARIEYYFSEFLSKLEMRRLVARDGRLLKEHEPLIGLEIFGGCHKMIEGEQVDEGPKFLFANTNTLFVGTMNEDETTQSLSDKVIDRANVLYFGRPGRLQPQVGAGRAENGGGVSVARVRAPLETDTWRAWCKPVDAGALTMATEVLSDLNVRLAEFNRPFAHRTYQAMLSYIANYPHVDGEDENTRIRRALADQIGMRIMPKLRGVELNQNSQALKYIQGILSDSARLNDTLLNTAFDKAISTERGNGFFHWLGFDWAEADHS